MEIKTTTILIGFLLATVFVATNSLPVLDETSGIDKDTIEGIESRINETKKNLYVVKAVVYEIGILTEADSNETDFESQERIDLTFFDAHSNKSHIDLGNIPLPVQTNVTGQVLTGIAPINIGAFSSPQELLETIPLTGTIVNLTHSNTAFYQLTKSNKHDEDKAHLVDSEQLHSISDIGNLFESNSAALPVINSKENEA